MKVNILTLLVINSSSKVKTYNEKQMPHIQCQSVLDQAYEIQTLETH